MLFAVKIHEQRFPTYLHLTQKQIFEEKKNFANLTFEFEMPLLKIILPLNVRASNEKQNYRVAQPKIKIKGEQFQSN